MNFTTTKKLCTKKKKQAERGILKGDDYFQNTYLLRTA